MISYHITGVVLAVNLFVSHCWVQDLSFSLSHVLQLCDAMDQVIATGVVLVQSNYSAISGSQQARYGDRGRCLLACFKTQYLQRMSGEKEMILGEFLRPLACR